MRWQCASRLSCRRVGRRRWMKVLRDAPASVGAEVNEAQGSGRNNVTSAWQKLQNTADATTNAQKITLCKERSRSVHYYTAAIYKLPGKR